jgi:ATP-binding cassette subfamily F protein 3
MGTALGNGAVAPSPLGWERIPKNRIRDLPWPVPLLAATNLRHNYGDNIIIDGVSLSVEPGERVGIVGRNGCGKTTLMKILSGSIAPDHGTVNLQRSATAGYLHQDPNLELTDTVLEAAERAFGKLHDLHVELNHLFEKMAEPAVASDDAQLDALLRKQASLEHEIEAAGGYATEHKIAQVLHGLGFLDAQFSVKVAGLSGGQKGRLALAKLLLEEPDILLLDEPTNHLDIDGRLWLESFLTETFRGAVVMISHDRAMLDNVVTRILEVEQGRLIDYPGNYAAFREIRAERRLTMHRAYEKQQDRFKKEKEFILKYKAGQRAKQARGRETRLEREKSSKTLERPMEHATFKLELPRAERTGDIVAAARGLGKSYKRDDGTDKVLFKDLDVSIGRSERWGIIGPNGAGKTTLVKCLLGDMQADAGTVRLGSNVKIGYYRQLHDNVRTDFSVVQYLQHVILKEAPSQVLSEQQARNLAGMFLFSGEEQDRTLVSLSGGERSRAVLAGLLASAKNLLVLDEPTNHLDIPSAERLEDALAMPGEDGDDGYEGSLILISHDRALIDATCDHLLVLDGKGNAEVFLGNYSQWHEREVARSREAAQTAAEEKARREAEDKRRRSKEDEKKKRAPAPAPSANGLARLKTEQLEERITRLEKRLREIDAQLSDPDVWRNHDRSAKLGDERRRLGAELEPLEFEWARRAQDP